MFLRDEFLSNINLSTTAFVMQTFGLQKTLHSLHIQNSLMIITQLITPKCKPRSQEWSWARKRRIFQNLVWVTFNATWTSIATPAVKKFETSCELGNIFLHPICTLFISLRQDPISRTVPTQKRLLSQQRVIYWNLIRRK